MPNTLHVYNSLTGKKEAFEPINAPFVGMYTCGPTVYSDVHLGNCRTFISFDMVFRYLMHLGFKVRYVRNITDAGHLENDADEGEDKIAKKARVEQLEPMEIVQRYTVDFHKILQQFNNLPPSIEPTATGHIIEQIEMIKSIIDQGLGYEVNGSVYFDVPKYNETFKDSYGELSGRKLDDLIHGTRALDGQSEKRSPQDFALWKNASPQHIMRWPSPWGIGFPGWHLECSVMSTKYLGEEFDIHGGGMDLKFPHHEAEIAQCTAAHHKSPVKYWLHGNMLTLNGARMSKSTGNTLLPRELFTGDTDKLEKGYHPVAVRFFILQAHYRSTLDFSSEALNAAEKGFQRLMKAYALLPNLNSGDKTTGFDIQAFAEKAYTAMNDDFNTPVLISHLFDAAKFIQSVGQGKNSISTADWEELTSLMKGFIENVLGLYIVDEDGQATDNGVVDGLMDQMIDLRKRARQNKDFDTSDRIRDNLAQLGIVLKDGAAGTDWEMKG